MLAVILTLLLSIANARITDFSYAKYIPVLDGNVLVWEQYGLVKHSTNLSEFSSIIDSTVRMLVLFPQSHMRKLLEVDVNHAQNMLDELTVHHRMARSLDFLCSALKVVAGTPDAEDKLTDTVNKIVKEKRDGLVDSGHLFETLLATE